MSSLKPNFDTSNWQIHRRISIFLKVALLIGAILLFLEERYQSVFETFLILFITFLPMLLGSRFDVKIPHEFESLAIVLIYMSLFMGNVQDYYVRFWWWDIALHTGSGFLLGLVGFLLVYVLNEKKDISLDLNPGFIAIFAFMFAMGMGAIWEIFEFSVDQILGTTMQRSGLVDTMWDLIVDAIGAFIISFLGWGFLRTKETDSFLEEWINVFIDKNPKLFNRKKPE